ncbi:SHD1 domain-containing protein [Bremerella sp.]|uniref:SHD1 domain-containing protein n=1 Tax=Bremerella sp. TaxID=2795602 RepID=UPI00391C84A3
MPRSYCLVIWAAVVFAPTMTLAAEQRCALIDLDQSALGGLIEAELLSRPNMQWVERTEIQKLLDEQRLQSVLGAQSGNERRSIGTVLKADVLIILRTIEEEKKKYAQLVVAETNQGIRLVSQKLLLGKDPASDAEVLVKLANDGIAKSKGAIEHIFAVPPFVSDDLTYEYDYLKSTYAKLLERTLLDSPGVVVVELEEAKAITDEYNLSADGTNVARKLPTYVLGEYRNEGRGDDRRLKLSLKAQRGAKVLSERDETIAPDAVSGMLLKYAQELGSSQGIETATIDPHLEVKLLNERADLFIRLANWDEAQALVEASLLLDPDQPEMNSKAVSIIQRRLEDHHLEYLDELQRDIKLKRFALQHLRVMIEKSRFDLAKRHWLIFTQHVISGRPYYMQSDSDAKRLAQEGREFLELNNELAMQMVHGLAELKDWRLSSYLLHRAIIDLPTQQRYEMIKQVILKYQHLSDNEFFPRRFLLADEQPRTMRSLEGRAFLQDLINSEETLPYVRQTAQAILNEIQATRAATVTHRGNADAPVNNNLTFRRFDFEQFKTFRGISALGHEWDLVNADDGYFLYSQADGFRRIGDQGRNAYSSFKYDGKYIWITSGDGEGGVKLAVLDTSTWKHHELTQDNGLPILSRDEIPDVTVHRVGLSVTPIDVGRAIICGYVGRTWFADVKFDPEGNHQIKIFFEAKETLPADLSSVRRDDLSIRFVPGNIKLLQRRENGKVVERGLLVTRLSNSPVHYHFPLLINPEDCSVRVLEYSWSEMLGGWEAGGEIYRERAISLKDKELGFYRRGLGDKEKTLLISGYDEGKFYYDEQANILHIVGKQWCQANLETGEITSLGAVPWHYRNHWTFNDSKSPTRIEDGAYEIRQLRHTNNFGLVAECYPKAGGRVLRLQVFFDGSGDSFQRVAGIDDGKSSSEQTPPEFPPGRVTGRENLMIPGERVADMAYFPGGKFIASVSHQHNKAICVWNATTGDIVRSLLNDPKGMNCVVFSPSGETFATGGHEGRVILWDARTLRPLKQWTDLKTSVIDLAFSADASRLAANGQDAISCVWNVHSGEKQFDFIGYGSSGGFSKIAFTPDDQMLLAIQEQSGVRACDAKDGADLGKIETLDFIAGFLPDGSSLGVGRGSDNNLIQRQSDGLTRVVWPKFSGIPIAMSKDDRFIVSYYPFAIKGGKRDMSFGRIEVWDASIRKLVYSEEGVRVPRVSFSSDSTKLLVLDSKGFAKQVDLVKGAGQMEGKPLADEGKLLTPTRTWTDKTGKFHIDAALVEWDMESAVLKTPKGNQLTIPLSVLSEGDLRFLKEFAERN